MGILGNVEMTPDRSNRWAQNVLIFAVLVGISALIYFWRILGWNFFLAALASFGVWYATSALATMLVAVLFVKVEKPELPREQRKSDDREGIG